MSAEEYSRYKRLFVFVFLFLLFNLFYHYFLIGYLLGGTWPDGSFLFRGSDRFNDWFNSVEHMSSGQPYYLWRGAYFPFAYLMMLPASLASKQASLAYYFFLNFLAFFIFIKYILKYKFNSDKLKEACLLIFSFLLSYPVIFSLDRGNLDFLAACLVGIFLIKVRYDKVDFIAIICISIAASFKGFPGAFALILLFNRQYREFACFFLVSILLFLAGLAVLKGGIVFNANELLEGQAAFGRLFTLGTQSMRYASDPFTALKWANIVAGHLFTRYEYLIEVEKIYYFYTFFSMALLGYAIVQLFKRNIEFEYMVLLLAIISCLFPNVCNDYRLTMLIPALVLFIGKKKWSYRDNVIFTCISFLLVAKHVIFIEGVSVNLFVNASIFIFIVYFGYFRKINI